MTTGWVLPGDSRACLLHRCVRLRGRLSFRTPSASQKAWRATMRSRTPTPGRNFTPSSTTTTWPSRASPARCHRGCQFCRKRSSQSRRLRLLRNPLSEMGRFLAVSLEGNKGTLRDISLDIITDNLEVTHVWCNCFCLLMLLCKYSLLQTTHGHKIKCISALLKEL